MNSKHSVQTRRSSRLSILAVALLSLGVAPMLGCPGPEENNANNDNNTTTNNTTTTNNQPGDMGDTTTDDMGGTTTDDMGGTTTDDMGMTTDDMGMTGNDMGADMGTDMGMMEPSVTATMKSLNDVSTVVTVDEVYAEVGGWMVIHEDDAGSAGPVIGNVWVDAGTTTDVQVTLDRPAFDGETLYAMLHVDDPADMNYTFNGMNGEDPPAMNSDGVVVTPFDVEVTAGTPAVRLIVDAANTNTSRYRFEGAFPEAYDTIFSDLSADNPTLTLRQNWRYEIKNNALSNSHPIELIDTGGDAMPGTDTVRLSQNDTNTEDLTDPNNTVDWQESGDSVFFTYSGTLDGAIDAYRCGIHTGSMRGAIETFAP
jgi:hypothetical protein